MNYQETLDYLFSRLPMYQRIGSAAYKADLSNTMDLSNLLGDPYKEYPSVVIAGTNGKGSTAHLIASILQSAGYRTGLYTSPHYLDFRERIKVNGQYVSEKFVIDFIDKYKNDFEPIGLSFFEMTFGMAIQYFKKSKVDIAIFECGMGGRLDSTNIVDRDLSVITNIGLDHTHFLGDTLEKIAVEKAGIVQKGKPILIGERQEDLVDIFEEIAHSKNAPIYFADQSDNAAIISDLKFPLHGGYQARNLITALSAIQILKSKFDQICDEAIKHGVQEVLTQTKFIGRWQKLGQHPSILCDSGHNEDGIKEVVAELEKQEFERLHFVLGMVNDKKRDHIINLLPKKRARYYYVKPNIPRGLDSKTLKTSADEIGLIGESYDSVKAAIGSARQKASSRDLIFIGGSIFVVAEALAYFKS